MAVMRETHIVLHQDPWTLVVTPNAVSHQTAPYLTHWGLEPRTRTASTAFAPVVLLYKPIAYSRFGPLPGPA